MGSLTHKTALITGGTNGIGYGIAEALMKEGMHVMITGRDEEKAKASVAQLAAAPVGKISYVVADVRDLRAQERAVARVIEEWGKLDVLIANAGVGHFAPIDKMTVDQWNETIDTNLTGVFYSVKSSVEALKRTKGYIITISSLAGTNFFAEGGAYNASKFGLTGFTQAVMLDLRKYGIKVSTIMPGSVSTGFNNNPNMYDEKDNWKIQIEDIGQIVVDLLKMHPRTLPSKIEVRPSNPK